MAHSHSGNIVPEEALREFGLSENEIKTYLALLRLGKTSVPALSKQSGIHKSTVYDTLGKLEAKCLASRSSEAGSSFWSACDPYALMTLLESRKDAVNTAMPMLQKMYNLKRPERDVSIMSGQKAVLEMFRDMGEVGKEVRGIGSEMQIFPVMRYLLAPGLKKLWGKIPLTRMIAVDNTKTREQVLAFKKLFPFIEMRFYPERYLSPVATNVYGNRAAFVVWDSEPVVTIIKDASIAKAFGNYFEMIWKISKK